MDSGLIQESPQQSPPNGEAGPVVLHLNALTKHFGSIAANDKISLTLKRSEILALLGENGAGKTTLMNMVFGHYLPDAGHIDVADHAGILRPMPLGQPMRALKAGIGMVHQHFTLAKNINGLDNITLGTEKIWHLRRNLKSARKKINDLMEKSGLSVPLDLPVRDLSLGERQRVEILKALYRQAKILVLDEPTAVLSPQETTQLFATIKQLTRDGLSVIFIAHKLHEVMAFSDRIAVLRHGKKVGETLTRNANEKDIVGLMIGVNSIAKTARPPRKSGAAILQLNNLSVASAAQRHALKNISLQVKKHEILGIAGISGNGQKALAQVIAGLVTPESGNIVVNNQAIANPNPLKMMAAGIGAIPEDRHQEGIVGAMSVAENLILTRLNSPNIQSFGFLKQKAIFYNAKLLAKSYDIRGPGVTFPTRLLSGGNIQKLILARIFEQKPQLVLANQPTRGLDVGAAYKLWQRLLSLSDAGGAIILISEDLDEILSFSDRILVLRNGILIQAESHERSEIGRMMAG